MGELWLVPVYSPLHDPRRVREVVSGVLAKVSGLPGYTVRLWEPPETSGEGDALFLVVTGGTERRLLAMVEERGGPAILLAHPGQNSLPAALEAVARLRAEGHYAHVVYLGEEGSAALEELERWLRVVAVHRWMHSAHLGLVGAPSEWLVASSPAPALVTCMWGPKVVLIEMEEFLARLDEVDPGEVGLVREDFLARATRVREDSRAGTAGAREVSTEDVDRATGREVSAEDVRRAAAVYVALRRLVDDYRLDALTVRCFDLLGPAGTTGCLALSRLNDEGVVAGCEGDLPATVTMMLLSRLSGEPVFMGNPVRIDRGRETVWLAHCTVARRLVTSYALRSHFESGVGVAVAGELRNGPVTIARIGGPELDDLLAEAGTLVATGHEADLCRTQAVVRCPAAVSSLLDWPLGNHHVLAYGDLVREMYALCNMACVSSR
ncbi:MAG: hypothetical protein H5U04_10320 [Firmicutes bacterium]|nr:hypothetical protein [Bacillota bacterium]